MIRKLSHPVLAMVAGAIFAGSQTWTQPVAASEPFLGQIDYVGFNFAPRGWAPCDGQILPINQNQSLYSLLGTTFGGDGRTTFQLPDMRGRMPVHAGQGTGLTNRTLGEKGGVEQVILTSAQIPSHKHTLRGSTGAGDEATPSGHTLADDNPDETYTDAVPNTSMRPGALGTTAAQAHNNMPPYTVINCMIALQGVFPSRN